MLSDIIYKEASPPTLAACWMAQEWEVWDVGGVNLLFSLLHTPNPANQAAQPGGGGLAGAIFDGGANEPARRGADTQGTN